MRRIRNGHAGPALGVGPRGAHLLLTCDVSGKIGEHEKRIAVKQPVQQRTEGLAIASRKLTAADELECGAQFVVALDVVGRTIARALPGLHFWSSEPEQT